MHKEHVGAHARADVALAPILFDDHDRAAGEALRSSQVAKAEPSPAAKRKAKKKRTDDSLPVHSFRTLLADLATLTRNTVRYGKAPDGSPRETERNPAARFRSAGHKIDSVVSTRLNKSSTINDLQCPQGNVRKVSARSRPKAFGAMTRSKVPMHLQITNTLRQRIVSGRYRKSGLPAELSLMEEFDVSRHTIRAAMQRLVSDGLIERRAGKGTTVVRHRTAGQWVGSLETLLEFPIESIQFLEAKSHPAKAFPEIAASFGISPKGRIFRFTRKLLVNSEVSGISHLFLRPELASKVPTSELEKELLLTLVEEYGGVRATRAVQTISAAAADRQLARQLEVEVGAPLLVLSRSYTVQDGDKLMHIVLWCRPDRYNHTIEFVNEPKGRPSP
jgi:GntR family transcriptional regulator